MRTYRYMCVFVYMYIYHCSRILSIQYGQMAGQRPEALGSRCETKPPLLSLLLLAFPCFFCFFFLNSIPISSISISISFFFFFFFFFFDPNRDTGKDRDQGNQTTWGNALLFSCFCFQDTKGEELALVCSFQPSVLCLHPSSRSFLLPPCFTSAWTSILLSFCTALLCSETLFVYLSLCPCIVLSSILFSFPYRL